MKHLMISLLVAIVAMTATAQGNKADYRVVPLPDRIDGIKGADFRLTEQCLVNYPAGDRNMERNAAMLSQYVEEMTGMHLSTRPTVNMKDRTGNISLIIDPKMNGDEAYSILVTPKGIEISGRTAAGVFFGIQTLRKSLPVGTAQAINLPAAQLVSNPRFGYRGLPLGYSSRHSGCHH